jgi:hypothetical protein
VTSATVEAPLDLGATWRRLRFPVVLVALALLVSVVLAVIANAPPQRPLDPRDASPVGSRALAQLLRDRDVDVVAVDRVQSLQHDPAGTVFVPDPSSLTRAELRAAQQATGALVIVAPAGRELHALGLEVRPAGGVHEESVDARCSYPPAQTARDVIFGGAVYSASDATTCYPVGAGAGLVARDVGTVHIVVFGSAVTFTNAKLDEAGDAALGLGLLGQSPRLQWLLPRPPTQAPADQRHRGLTDLLPDRILWALAQLVLAVVVLALWRGRRLGPVVVEPLPVAVRATETVRGRARLLRAARARDTAAAALRAATTARLRELLGLGRDASRESVVESAAARSGRQGATVHALLYGAAPPDDTSLVSLARELDELEDAVRRL